MTADVLPVGLILTPNTARGRATLDAILGAAVEVFSSATSGRAASIAAVAKRISLSPAAIYQYFPDREAVLLAAIEQDAAHLFDAAIASVAEHEHPMSSLVFGMNLESLAPDFPLAVSAIVDERIDLMTLPRVQLRIETCTAMIVRELKHAQAQGNVRHTLEVRKLAESIMTVALATSIPDRLVGASDSARSMALRYLAVAAAVPEPKADQLSEFLKGRAALTATPTKSATEVT